MCQDEGVAGLLYKPGIPSPRFVTIFYSYPAAFSFRTEDSQPKSDRGGGDLPHRRSRHRLQQSGSTHICRWRPPLYSFSPRCLSKIPREPSQCPVRAVLTFYIISKCICKVLQTHFFFLSLNLIIFARFINGPSKGRQCGGALHMSLLNALGKTFGLIMFVQWLHASPVLVYNPL